MALSQMDDEREFRDILEEANRSNCTFYPVDPRGLVVFDSSLADHRTGNAPPGSTTIVPPSTDLSNLRNRINSLRTLAEATDGVAVVNTNDLRGALGRIAADMSSYYLLGYYSTGRLDGKYHSITVRVKRPGVQVRARRGYRALTPETAAPPAATPAVDPAVATLNAAVASLSAIRPQTPIRFRVGYGFGGTPAAGNAAATIWVAGELDSDRTLTKEWDSGGTAAVLVTGADRAVIASAQGTLAPGARNMLVALPQGGTIAPGEYAVRIDARPREGLGVSETARVTVPTTPTSGDPLLFRRGPFSGAGWQPVGDPRFRRQERIRVEVPVAAAGGTVSVRLLGRNGTPLEVPITTSENISSGLRTVVGELALAPLAASDYVLAITITHDGQQQRVLAAFRILPS